MEIKGFRVDRIIGEIRIFKVARIVTFRVSTVVRVVKSGSWKGY